MCNWDNLARLSPIICYFLFGHQSSNLGISRSFGGSVSKPPSSGAGMSLEIVQTKDPDTYVSVWYENGNAYWNRYSHFPKITYYNTKKWPQISLILVLLEIQVEGCKMFNCDYSGLSIIVLVLVGLCLILKLELSILLYLIS